MEFRIADTFTDSLARLTGEEQKAVKTTAFDLQMNPAHPSMQLHKIEKSRDKNFWSVRVGSDIRLIVHRSEANLLLCYVGHHDKAYDWAERRKLETHPKTGAAQLIVVRETVQEIITRKVVEAVQPAQAKRLLFSSLSDEELLAFGIPIEWLKDVREIDDEDRLLTIADLLPSEAAEALIVIATGGKLKAAPPAVIGTDPFVHPDAQRRFRIMNNVEELERALEFPWDKWTVFLHPDQRQWVERDYNGPARISGSAGTGKTIVALHRAVFLARKHPESRVLLTTFSDILANALRTKLRRLVSNEPHLAERLEVHSIEAIALRMFKPHLGDRRIVSSKEQIDYLKSASSEVAGHKFSLAFLVSEWKQVVDAWQLDSWDSYRDVRRLGRKTRLSEIQRTVLWSIFEKVRNRLAQDNLITMAELFRLLSDIIFKTKNPIFDFAIVDEAQDIEISHLRFLVALAGDRTNSLFFAGDLGQRIFQQPFSWLTLGVDIRGRAKTLHVNYRTSHQIRMQADRLLSSEVSDLDGNVEERAGTISVFNGSPPSILILKDQEEETKTVGAWLLERQKQGVLLHEMGVFVRSDSELDRATKAIQSVGLPFKILNENVAMTSGQVSVCTMHLTKGLEFRSVVVMACDDEIIPSQERIESISDKSDLEEVYNTERHLLYVACTRARDHLLVTCVDPASEFLSDLISKS